MSSPKESDGGKWSLRLGYSRTCAIINLDPDTLLNWSLNEVGTQKLEEGLGSTMLVLKLNNQRGPQVGLHSYLQSKCWLHEGIWGTALT